MCGGGADDVQKTDDKLRVGRSEVCLEFSGVRNIFVRFTCVFLRLSRHVRLGHQSGKEIVFPCPHEVWCDDVTLFSQ